ncbi:MAG: abortive infection family protein [Deltaproteobacteria bacterium]|nr:abortive infection family protein [Deltaproteobacteria bacterium]
MKIPNPVIEVIAGVLSEAHTHKQLDKIFANLRFPGDSLIGTKHEKCERWLRYINLNADEPSEVIGGLLESLLEEQPALDEWSPGLKAELIARRNAPIVAALTKYHFKYETGGHIYPEAYSSPSHTLEEILRKLDLPAMNAEFARAEKNLNTDPASAVLAACDIIESFCTIYIEDHPHLTMPAEQTVQPLWKQVQIDLGLDPAKKEDQDIKRILGGVATLVDGLGALRTHASSAHGKGRKVYRVEPRHARLAVNAAHTLAVFLLETWEGKRVQPQQRP